MERAKRDKQKKPTQPAEGTSTPTVPKKVPLIVIEVTPE
jgi:hypothetical protein